MSPSLLYMGIVVPVTILAPGGTAVVRYPSLSGSMRRIGSYLLVATAGNAVAVAFALQHRNNLAFLHVYTALELFMLTRFFGLVLDKPGERRAAQITGYIFPLLCAVNVFFLQGTKAFNSYTRPLESIVLLIFSLLYLNSNIRNEERPDLFMRRPETWVVVGILLYFSSALFQFAFANIVSQHASLYTRLLIWNLHATFVMIMYLLFTVGFIRCRK